MSDANPKRSENKYLEVALILANFFIPFVGLLIALKNYLGGAGLSISYFLLLAFIGGNIMTWLIFILDGKKVMTKSLWTGGILLAVLIINFLVVYVGVA
jgi:hypothetical protein